MAKVSPIGRVSYPAVFEPSQYGQNEPKFSLTLLFDENDPLLAEMKKDAARAASEKWPNGVPKNIRSPFRSGDERNEEKGGTCPEYAGKCYVKFQTSVDRPPQVVGPDKHVITAASGEFYPGCHARVSYTVYAYDAQGNKGVAFGLCNVQKIRDDDPFDARTTADQDFDSVGGGASSDLF